MFWSTRYSRCVYLALSTLDVVIKDYYFEVLPRLRVPHLSLLCAPVTLCCISCSALQLALLVSQNTTQILMLDSLIKS